MIEFSSLDRMVGRIAGAIYTDAAPLFPYPPMVLIPGLTFKVHKILSHRANWAFLSEPQKMELAKEIQVSIAPMLFAFEMNADAIEKIGPAIESAVLEILENPHGQKNIETA